MNTTASYSSEHSWSRRCSTETIFSIQGKETDFVRDTSDTDACDSDATRGFEFEPATEAEDEPPLSGDSSGETDNEIIATKVIEVSVGDDGDLEFADSEQTDSEGSDSEMDLYDYWHCAQCRAHNNNPLYRYCEKCFKVRKNFFPPRPKRKKRPPLDTETVPRTLSQDSGVESQDFSQALDSQDLSQNDRAQSMYNDELSQGKSQPDIQDITQNGSGQSMYKVELSQGKSQPDSQDSANPSNSQLGQYDRAGSSTSRRLFRNRPQLKRRAESADRNNKRMKVDYTDTDSDSSTDSRRKRKSKSAEVEVKPLIKTISDPSLTFDDIKITKKVISNTLKEKLDDNMCIVCYNEPKSGVFVHGRIAHICCCYKCAVKVWAKAKRCPVCNCKVSNVLKAVVM